MLDPCWFYVTNDLLLIIYRKAVEKNLNKDLIESLFNEVKRRNLRIDKPRHLKRIK